MAHLIAGSSLAFAAGAKQDLKAMIDACCVGIIYDSGKWNVRKCLSLEYIIIRQTKEIMEFLSEIVRKGTISAFDGANVTSGNSQMIR